MCTVLLPPGVNPIAVKYTIISYQCLNKLHLVCAESDAAGERTLHRCSATGCFRQDVTRNRLVAIPLPRREVPLNRQYMSTNLPIVTTIKKTKNRKIFTMLMNKSYSLYSVISNSDIFSSPSGNRRFGEASCLYRQYCN